MIDYNIQSMYPFQMYNPQISNGFVESKFIPRFSEPLIDADTEINDYLRFLRYNNEDWLQDTNDFSTWQYEDPVQFARDVISQSESNSQSNYTPEQEEPSQETKQQPTQDTETPHISLLYAENQDNAEESTSSEASSTINTPTQPTYNTSYTFSFINAKDYYKSRWDKFNKAFDAVIKQDPSAAKYRNLLSEIAYLESKFIPYIPNRVGALGYFQFMPSTRQDLKRMSGINFTDAQLKNDPELQIKLGIILAKYFENGLQSDKEAMRNKGITMSGAIAGAWFSGLGSKKKRNGVRGYIYYGNNPSDGNMRIREYIRRINNVPLEGYPSYASTNTSTTSVSTQSVTAPSMPKPTGTLPNSVTVAPGTVVQNAMSGADTLPTFNLTKCFNTMYYNTNYRMKGSRHNKSTWIKKSRTSSGHYCARGVSLGMDAGGLNTDYGKLTATGRPDYAGLYMGWLPKAGFYMLPDDTTDFQPGDICVTRGRGSRSKSDGKPMGHISMFDGKDWISDYFQRSYASDNWRVWRTAKRGGIDPAGGETHFFRYKGKITY